MNSAKSTPPSKVIYSPPTRRDIDAYVRKVGRVLGGSYNEREFMDGLAAQLKVAGRIEAQYRNRKNQEGFDNAEQAG